MTATCVEWGAVNAVLFDNPKTEPTLFHSRRQTAQIPAAQVTLPDGNVIWAEEVQRWLRICFNRKSSFKHLVRTKAASALKAFTAISRLASTEQGLSYKVLRQLFQTYVSIINNIGAKVWWNRQVGFRTIIQQTENQAMRKIAGAFRTTPTAAPEAETALSTISIRLDEMQRKYALRLLSMPPTRQDPRG